ncbi:MAG: TolC family protein, partial [Kofleriaceae bacterium]|nr:TolC family protein [Kofleriaceae bacterium]
MLNLRHLVAAIAAGASMLTVGGCLPSASQLRQQSNQQLAARWTSVGDATSSNAAQRAALVAKLLTVPLTQASVVKLALANNPAMLMAFDELDIAAADVGIALAPPAVHLDFSVRFNASSYELESEALIDVMALLNRAVHRKLGAAAAIQAQSMATARAIELGSSAELAYLAMVAAQQEAALRQQVFDAADAAVAVRQRMHAAGNTTDLAMARELDQREQTRVELGRAQLAVEIAREQLNAAVGFTGQQTRWTIAESLPTLPAAPPALDELETEAVAANLGIVAAQAQTAAAAERTGIARKRQWLPELAAGVAVVNHGSGVEAGPAIRIGLPWLGGAGAMADRSAAELRRAEHQLTALAIDLRAAARAARQTALATFAEAKQLRDVVVPLRRRIVDETLLHYNAMNADPFTLIMAQRELTDGNRQLLAAQ